MLFTPFICLDKKKPWPAVTLEVTAGHWQEHTSVLTRTSWKQTMQSVFFVYLRKISFSVMLSVYIFLYFLYFGHRGYFLWPVWKCLMDPQIYAHAGKHMHRNNTVGTRRATCAEKNTIKHTHIHTHTHTHTHTHRLLGCQQPVFQGAEITVQCGETIQR